jgi:hypothetical protein
LPPSTHFGDQQIKEKSNQRKSMTNKKRLEATEVTFSFYLLLLLYFLAKTMTEIDESNYEKYDLKSWLDIPQSSNWIQALDPEVRLSLRELRTKGPLVSYVAHTQQKLH